MTDLHVQVRGSGPAILFIHGATLDHRAWQPQVDRLAERFTCVSYDVRGYGRSPAPTGRFRHCDDAAAVIDHVGLDRPIVVGHSIGALYALELCFVRPVAALVSVCMSGLLPYPDERLQVFARIRAAAKDSLAAAKQIWLGAGWLTPMRAAARPAIEAMVADYGGYYWTHDSPSYGLDPPPVTRLEELRVPAVIVDGAHDLPYNHAVADELARRIDGARLLRLANAGHMAGLDEPDAISEAIAASRPSGA